MGPTSGCSRRSLLVLSAIAGVLCIAGVVTCLVAAATQARVPLRSGLHSLSLQLWQLPTLWTAETAVEPPQRTMSKEDPCGLYAPPDEGFWETFGRIADLEMSVRRGLQVGVFNSENGEGEENMELHQSHKLHRRRVRNQLSRDNQVQVHPHRKAWKKGAGEDKDKEDMENDQELEENIAGAGRPSKEEVDDREIGLANEGEGDLPGVVEGEHVSLQVEM